MTIRLEAWTLPESGSFTKKIGPIPYNGLRVGPRYLGVGNGSFSVAYGWDKLTEVIDPTNNVETMIRVFEDTTNVYNFYARFSEIGFDTQGNITISGPGPEGALDQVLNYPLDWAGSDTFPASRDTNVSLFMDTVYGGENILANPGFEVGLTNDLQGISHDYVAESTLSGAIDDTQTSLTVADGTNFPASDFRIVIDTEWIHVTTRTGNSFTGLTRGYLGTTAASHTDTTQVFGGGWFTLTYNAATTGRLEWNATPAEIEFELEALGNIIDVSVDGEGTVNVAPWLIEFADPGEQDNAPLTANTTNLVNGAGTQFNIVEKQKGGIGVPDPWTKSYDPNTNFVHGGYTAYQVGSVALYGDPAHSGDRALGIQPEVPTPQGEDNYPGTQQIVPVTPAGIYQAAAWVYPTVAGMDFAIVVRDLNEKKIRRVDYSNLPANTWTLLEISDLSIPVNVNQIIFRVAALLPPDNAAFWIDDCEFKEGYGPATPGQIVINMRTFATAQSRDGLSWLDFSSFSATLDSAGVAWDKEVSVYIPSGSSWLAVLNTLADQGYEWRVRWTGTVFALDLFNPGAMGTTITDPQLAPHRIKEAFVRSSSPSHNVILGEGGNNIVSEVEDAALVAAYGRREGFGSDADQLDVASLEAELNHALALRIAQKKTAKLTTDDSIRLGFDYGIGDTITTDIPGHVPRTGYRVWGALINVDQKGSITRTVDVGRYVHKELIGGTTSSVTSDAVNWLLRQKRKIQRLEKVTADIANAIPDPQEYGTGAAHGPVIVAASDAPQVWIDAAAYVCDGTDDHVEIFDALYDQVAGSPWAGDVLLSPGQFFVGTDQIDMNVNLRLRGSGYAHTIIRPQDNGTSTTYIVRVGTECELSDLFIWDGNLNTHVGNGVHVDTGRVQNVKIQCSGAIGLFMEPWGQNSSTGVQVGGNWDIGVWCESPEIHLDGLVVSLQAVGAVGMVWDTSSSYGSSLSNFYVRCNNGIGMHLNGGGITMSSGYINGGDRAIETTSSCFDISIVGCQVISFSGDGWLLGPSTSADEVVISDCLFNVGGSHINASGASSSLRWATITGNQFWRGERGIFSAAFLNHTIIANNLFYQQNQEAIRSVAVNRQVEIHGNRIFDVCRVSGGAGIYVDSVGDTVDRGVGIVNNVIDACISDGIYVLNTEHVQVQNNRLLRVRGHQFRFNNCDQGIVSGNYADPDTNAVTPSDGILLEGDTNELLITNNKLVPDIDGINSRWGINISAATCDANIVVLNDLRPSADWASGALNDAGTGTVTTVPTGNFT